VTLCEHNLLQTLMSHPHRIFAPSELINIVQGYDFEGYERTMDAHIKNLGQKLAGHLPGPGVITSIYGVGYKFNVQPQK
jgi:two-component system response regulator BaeR